MTDYTVMQSTVYFSDSAFLCGRMREWKLRRHGSAYLSHPAGARLPLPPNCPHSDWCGDGAGLKRALANCPGEIESVSLVSKEGNHFAVPAAVLVARSGLMKKTMTDQSVSSVIGISLPFSEETLNTFQKVLISPSTPIISRKTKIELIELLNVLSVKDFTCIKTENEFYYRITGENLIMMNGNDKMPETNNAHSPSLTLSARATSRSLSLSVPRSSQPGVRSRFSASSSSISSDSSGSSVGTEDERAQTLPDILGYPAQHTVCLLPPG